jgi:hypothetical protein
MRPAWWCCLPAAAVQCRVLLPPLPRLQTPFDVAINMTVVPEFGPVSSGFDFTVTMCVPMHTAVLPWHSAASVCVGRWCMRTVTFAGVLLLRVCWCLQGNDWRRHVLRPQRLQLHAARKLHSRRRLCGST